MLVASGTLAGDSHTSVPDNPLQSDRKIRIGVVGGGFGCSFQWHEHPNCIVYAVSDLRTDRRGRLMQVYKCDRAYESLEKLILDGEIEAVAVLPAAARAKPASKSASKRAGAGRKRPPATRASRSRRK